MDEGGRARHPALGPLASRAYRARSDTPGPARLDDVMVDPELVKQVAASGQYLEFEDFKRRLFGHEAPFGILGTCAG